MRRGTGYTKSGDPRLNAHCVHAFYPSHLNNNVGVIKDSEVNYNINKLGNHDNQLRIRYTNADY